MFKSQNSNEFTSFSKRASSQASPSLELVVVEAVFSEDEEVVLLVALAVLALHVPVVLASHLVLVLLKFDS